MRRIGLAFCGLAVMCTLIALRGLPPTETAQASTQTMALVDTGEYHTCAVRGGGVRCWGFNPYGELGNGTNTSSSVPVQVVGLTGGVQTVAVGEQHACALLLVGTVKCWGFNQYGALGSGN